MDSGTGTEPLELKISLSREVMDALDRYSERNGCASTESIYDFLTEGLKRSGDLEENGDDCGARKVTKLETLHWECLVPIARNLPLNKEFSIADLIIRLHSKENLDSLRIPSAWHSAFAVWTKRTMHVEFEQVRRPEGLRYIRKSGVQNDLPFRKKKEAAEPKPRRMTAKGLMGKLVSMSHHREINVPFKLADLMADIPKETMPRHWPAQMFGVRLKDALIYTGDFSHQTQYLDGKIVHTFTRLK